MSAEEEEKELTMRKSSVLAMEMVEARQILEELLALMVSCWREYAAWSRPPGPVS